MVEATTGLTLHMNLWKGFNERLNEVGNSLSTKDNEVNRPFFTYADLWIISRKGRLMSWRFTIEWFTAGAPFHHNKIVQIENKNKIDNKKGK